MQFRTLLFPCKKCVTEKITKVKTLLIGSMSSLLTVFLSIPFDKLPWCSGSNVIIAKMFKIIFSDPGLWHILFWKGWLFLACFFFIHFFLIHFFQNFPNLLFGFCSFQQITDYWLSEYIFLIVIKNSVLLKYHVMG